MNETRKYLDHHAKVSADNVTATVTARNDEGTYMVETIGARAVRRAGKANPADEFAVGARVVISEPSASRNVIGSQAIIISRAPREQRGLSGSTPAERQSSSETVTLTSVTPDPLVLVAGGPQGTQTLVGSGFTADPVYSAEVGDDPTFSDASAYVEDTLAESYLTASGLSALGEFDVTVNGRKARKALRIIAADPEVVLYIPSARVLGVWPERGTLIRRSAILPTAATRCYGVESLGVVVAFYGAGGGCVLPKSLKTFTERASPLFPAPNATTQLADDEHGCVWYGGAMGLAKVNVLTGVATIIHNNGGEYEGVAYDPVRDVILACEKSTRNVRRFNRETGALTDTELMPSTYAPRSIIVTPAHVFVLCHPFTDSGSAIALQLDADTLAVVDLASAGTNAYPVGLAARIGDDGVTAVGAPLFIVRGTTAGGAYDASATMKLMSFVANFVYGPAASLANFSVMSAGFIDRAGTKLAMVGRTADASRLYIVTYGQLITGGGPPAGQIGTLDAVECEAAVPATPVPSGFLSR